MTDITVKITPDSTCGWRVQVRAGTREISWHSTGSRHTARLIAKHIEEELERTRQSA